ncbi:anthocyanidin reductase-like [Dorcoceras hygrometricum]|uniref:Anthocyanidin reductase-like n=1 Tax=Dorcoceras hygrometricum TaxID=472368 RepID=A0A2Z7A0P3_9LAMI|nr:anthocyanidin reductase-like [Dorcoceras hygrometricum]
MEEGKCKVCVTGGSGYIASALIKKLLSEGYIVHTTLRDLNDHPKIDTLKSFYGADTGLKLFKADIYRPEEFEEAILGCEFVFHVATPLLHSDGNKFLLRKQYKNRVDATVDSAKRIASLCVRTGTVRRLLYTASVMAASPLKDDGSGYKEFMDETCWTPANFSIPYTTDFLEEYTKAKTFAERELLSFGDGKLEVVTLACGLVGGETLMPNTPGSVLAILGLLTNDEFGYTALKFLENLLAKVPLAHIEDVINALVFCMKEQTMGGRFLCAKGYVSTADMARYYQNKYPEFSIKREHLECPKRYTKWVSVLLEKRGFEYKYDWRVVLDDSVRCAKKNADVGI